MDDVYGNMQNPDLNVSVLLSGIVMLTVIVVYISDLN